MDPLLDRRWDGQPNMRHPTILRALAYTPFYSMSLTGSTALQFDRGLIQLRTEESAVLGSGWINPLPFYRRMGPAKIKYSMTDDCNNY